MTGTVPAGPEAVASSQTGPPTKVDTIVDWWSFHCHPENGNPGTRARLRRADSAVKAATIEAAVILVRRLRAIGDGTSPNEFAAERVLNLARVLAHVKEHDPRLRPMDAARRSRDGATNDNPRLSEVRFRRLLETDAGEEQVDAFRRLVVLLDGKVDVKTLGHDFIDWGHPFRGSRVRQRWAFDYYDAYIARPIDSLAITITEDDDA